MIPQAGCIGILTAGGDCPGLNAAIRALTLAAVAKGINVVGIQDGFGGLIDNRTVPLTCDTVNRLLPKGGTILGTSRTKIHKVKSGNSVVNMEDIAISNIMTNRIDTLVCLGGGGTQKNALKLMKRGVNIVTLPKTIDNDVCGTDLCFGYDSAVQIATEAIDRLFSTASSHHRIMVCELMGHKAGWLTMSAGLASGADVVLIPEIPYDLNVIAGHIEKRRSEGKKYSIIAVAEGAVSKEQLLASQESKKQKANDEVIYDSVEDAAMNKTHLDEPVVEKRLENDSGMVYHMVAESLGGQIARKLQAITGIEARSTVLGHIQRGGAPSAADRMLCTIFGTYAISEIAAGKYNIMVGLRNNLSCSVPLEEVAGKRKLVPPDHPLIQAARITGVCLGE